MSFETGVFPVLVSEDEAVESLPPQVRGGLNASSATCSAVRFNAR